MKRLHAAGYGQVGFNYDTPSESVPETQIAEVEEPFEPTTAFKALLPVDTVLVSICKFLVYYICDYILKGDKILFLILYY